MRAFLYSLRCRLGAWLLREHIATMCEHYADVTKAHRLKGLSMAERTEYIGIGLRYAAGIGTRWRRWDDDQARMAREMRQVMEHAKDAL